MIGIINYGVGNLKSVKNSLDYLGIRSMLISKLQDFNKCKKIILPGVGAFGAAMEKLTVLGFAGPIKEFAESGKPILGICLGMQLLFDESEELGNHQGLGILAGKVLALDKKVKKLPLPLIGWVDIKSSSRSPLLENLGKSTFYFVHGYYCQPENSQIILAKGRYGIEFPAIVGYKNIYGCQFHPEKSQSDGLRLLKNFAKL